MPSNEPTIALADVEVRAHVIDRLQACTPHARDKSCMSVHASAPRVQLCAGTDPVTVSMVGPTALHVRVPDSIRDKWVQLEKEVVRVAGTMLPPAASGRVRRIHSVLGGDDSSTLKLRVDQSTHVTYDFETRERAVEPLGARQLVVPIVDIRGLWANPTHYGIVACAHVTAVVAGTNDDNNDHNNDDMTTQATMPHQFHRADRPELASAQDQCDQALTDDDGDFETEVCLRRLNEHLQET